MVSSRLSSRVMNGTSRMSRRAAAPRSSFRRTRPTGQFHSVRSAASNCRDSSILSPLTPSFRRRVAEPPALGSLRPQRSRRLREVVLWQQWGSPSRTGAPAPVPSL